MCSIIVLKVGEIKMNNFKKIRELYGITQAEVAQAINVNRVTIANWENDSVKASKSNLEKLSLFYGIGPEFFYEKNLDAIAESIIISTGQKQRSIEKQSAGTRSKVSDFSALLSKTSFKEAIQRYMFAMKILLATSDNGNLSDLKNILTINKKMSDRLEHIVKLREEEEQRKEYNNEPTLSDLIKEYSDE